MRKETIARGFCVVWRVTLILMNVVMYEFISIISCRTETQPFQQPVLWEMWRQPNFSLKKVLIVMLRIMQEQLFLHLLDLTIRKDQMECYMHLIEIILIWFPIYMILELMAMQLILYEFNNSNIYNISRKDEIPFMLLVCGVVMKVFCSYSKTR